MTVESALFTTDRQVRILQKDEAVDPIFDEGTTGSAIIWNKPNCQPESVKDRPTRSHEYVFRFSKSERYLYNHDALRGPHDRNLRSVWDINTQAYKEAHFATFPAALVAPCIALGSRPGELVLDPFIGSGTTGQVALTMDRRFVVMELNPDYVDIAERHLNGSAKHV
ncbi:MAG: DNA-methyltransferase [Dehalococcoidia bacterium]